METLVKFMPVSQDLWMYVLIDIGIVLFLLLILRVIQGVFAKVNVTEEISEKDNFAYGIGMAGGMLALCIVLSSVIGRHIGQGLEKAALGMLIFGVVGILLVRIGRYIHDKVVLNRIDTVALLKKKNVGIALVDAASAVASAIIIRSMIFWVEGSDANAVIAITSGFFVVLAISIVLTRVYEYRFAQCNQNDSFQGALKRGQLAVAIDHAGNILGTAIVVTTSAELLVYSAANYVSNVTGWLFMSLILAVGLQLLVYIGKTLVLFGVDINREIDQHHNIGIACVGVALNMGLAMLVAGFFLR